MTRHEQITNYLVDHVHGHQDGMFHADDAMTEPLNPLTNGHEVAILKDFLRFTTEQIGYAERRAFHDVVYTGNVEDPV